MLDRAVIGLFLLGAVVLGARAWLAENPQHNPWVPLEIDHPIGWATRGKLDQLRTDRPECRAVLDRGNVVFTSLQTVGEGACLRNDRLVLSNAPLSPAAPQMTCPVATGLEMWLRHGVEPAAREVLGTELSGIDHLGTYSCRRMNGAATGMWSEHATGNAIDIAAFRFADGRRITLLGDWEGADEEAEFLRRIRDAACSVFATVLSPDYNAAHADHFHLDQAQRNFRSACR